MSHASPEIAQTDVFQKYSEPNVKHNTLYNQPTLETQVQKHNKKASKMSSWKQRNKPRLLIRRNNIEKATNHTYLPWTGRSSGRNLKNPTGLAVSTERREAREQKIKERVWKKIEEGAWKRETERKKKKARGLRQIKGTWEGAQVDHVLGVSLSFTVVITGRSENNNCLLPGLMGLCQNLKTEMDWTLNF